MSETSFTNHFIAESIEILSKIPVDEIEAVVELIRATREREGRVFFCGSGGGAAHASHAAADFRKLANVEAYCITDNVAELTARVNDEGWDVSYSNWLAGSRMNNADCLFVFSVGGGNVERGVSTNLVNAIELAKHVGASVTGVVGREGGFLKKLADCCVLLPTMNPDNVTAQTEALQAVMWHLMVTHPALLQSTPRWESLDRSKSEDRVDSDAR